MVPITAIDGTALTTRIPTGAASTAGENYFLYAWTDGVIG